jgi:hypothetical protein
VKTKDLPPSSNVEDRRGEEFDRRPRLTFAEMLERPPFKPIPDSTLAEQAGIKDIK